MFSTGKTCKFRRTLFNRQLIQFVRIPAEFVARLNLVFSTANGVYVLWNLSTVSGPYFPGYQRFSYPGFQRIFFLIDNEAALKQKKAARRKKNFFLLGALRLVNAASPRTISVHKKKISSGTQGTVFLACSGNFRCRSKPSLPRRRF